MGDRLLVRSYPVVHPQQPFGRSVHFADLKQVRKVTHGGDGRVQKPTGVEKERISTQLVKIIKERKDERLRELKQVRVDIEARLKEGGVVDTLGSALDDPADASAEKQAQRPSALKEMPSIDHDGEEGDSLILPDK
eukprot:CAMPEP_0185590046 /NCGR_PEP_ID=MMETSP0434-20130131/59297_1 /TAXON_ID=626734 ORGANISM="Favella taraikaensis, Strain Fe Narragansett Bay" /NCGR_SAMPLE_ID=MMETSP0434 /ASSEMBLY_ACC=CAM_ASM_000379 /LENGTH=135 /DNA_ID=CAMNT_0028213917 /DNA_START=154 /DNA_END=562 /DNA_ORIENTATION=-